MKKSLLLIVTFLLLTTIASACTSLPGLGFFSRKTSTSTSDLLFNNWEDRTIFSSGLVSSQQDVLNQLPGASVYHIDIKIADDLTSLTGTETVFYTNREDWELDRVDFQLYPNQLGGSVILSNIQVDGKPAETIYLEGHSAVVVLLPSVIHPGDSVKIGMDFSVDFSTTGGGNYGLFGFIDNILVLDGFYPGIPVYDQASWHAGPLPPNADTTFNDASFYLVRVSAPGDLVLATSGVEVGREKNGKNQQVTFAAGPARDFYIAASKDFVKESKTEGNTVVNSYTLSGFDQGSDLALKTASEALMDFSLRYGDYPYTEFDVVSTPMQGATGIEYSGIVGINKLIYDQNETISGTPAFVMLETTVAHEVGHQWFYNMVGNDQANQPWIDESLTQYVTAMYFKDEYGQKSMEQYEQSWANRWNRVNDEAKPIGLPAADYQGAEYSAIVYGRGPIFIKTLAETMGQASFDQFLKEYVYKFEWQISSTEDFKQLAETTCACKLDELFTKWVYPE